jgi:IS30 family transposase
MKTTEFTLDEREELSRLLSQGRTLIDIANLLSKDRTTISREVSRMGMDRYTYRAHKVNWHAKREEQARQEKKNRSER